jgi:hypothetical protein
MWGGARDLQAAARSGRAALAPVLVLAPPPDQHAALEPLAQRRIIIDQEAPIVAVVLGDAGLAPDRRSDGGDGFVAAVADDVFERLQLVDPVQLQRRLAEAAPRPGLGAEEVGRGSARRGRPRCRR